MLREIKTSDLEQYSQCHYKYYYNKIDKVQTKLFGHSMTKFIQEQFEQLIELKVKGVTAMKASPLTLEKLHNSLLTEINRVCQHKDTKPVSTSHITTSTKKYLIIIDNFYKNIYQSKMKIKHGKFNAILPTTKQIPVEVDIDFFINHKESDNVSGVIINYSTNTHALDINRVNNYQYYIADYFIKGKAHNIEPKNLIDLRIYHACTNELKIYTPYKKIMNSINALGEQLQTLDRYKKNEITDHLYHSLGFWCDNTCEFSDKCINDRKN